MNHPRNFFIKLLSALILAKKQFDNFSELSYYKIMIDDKNQIKISITDLIKDKNENKLNIFLSFLKIFFKDFLNYLEFHNKKLKN